LSVRSITTGPSSANELLAPATPAERAPTDVRFEQELGRESARLSHRGDEAEEPVAMASERARDDATPPDEGDALDDATAHDALGPVGEGDETALRDGEADADDDDRATSDGDDELAALEQLLLAVSGAPQQTATIAPTIAPSGGDSTLVAEGTVAAIATSGVANGAKSGAPAGTAAGSATVATATTAAQDAESGDESTIEGAGDESATVADFAAAVKAGVAARAKGDGDALDTSAAGGTEPAPATLDPALAERLARELAEARPPAEVRPLAAPNAVAASAPASESVAPAGLARATTTLAQLPALLDDGFVRLQRHDGRWEAEIRLDPPELGVVRVRLELDGGHLRVVARCDDRGVEQQLEQHFREWDQDLRKQGGEASFDLGRRAKEEERAAMPARGERSLPQARAARSGGGVGPGAGLRVDLLA